MVDPQPLRALPSAMVRMSALPADAARRTLVDIDPTDVDAVTRYLHAALADPVVREAVAVSSRSLTHTLDALEAGRGVDAKKVRRAGLALTRYLLRMATRPTPFGLMAGVSPARFGDRTAVRIGTDHRKGVRADAGWLDAVVRHRLQDPEIVRPLLVVINNLCTVRGDRLVLSYVPMPAERERAPRELSVRNNALVAAVRVHARRPIVFAALVEELCAEVSGATPSAVERLLLQLVGCQILLTELAPLPGSDDPVEHVLARLPGDVELGRAAEAMRRYAEAPIGAGLARWHAAVPASDVDRWAPHVDLALDSTVELHREVAAEIERAAAVLVRLTPADVVPSYLRHYHLDFLERYGDQLVPLVELLDATTGLDAPAGYQVPRSTREPQHDPRVRRSVERDRLRGALLQEAILDGTGEVVLDDALLDRLAIDHDGPPREAEFGVEIIARSTAAIDAGDFRVVLSPTLMGQDAGAMAGRFAYLLGAPGITDDGGARAAQLEFVPAFARSANLTRVPRLRAHTVPVGIFADPDEPGVIGVDDLLVGADEQGLFLWSARLDVEVLPALPHMLDVRTQAPNVVRFLSDVAAFRHGGIRKWDWGAAVADKLPYLPRVRSGRIVFSPASWRLDPALADRRLPDHAWQTRFAAWRARWRVPRHVALVVVDNRVSLDLDAPLHRALLRHEVERRPEVFLFENGEEQHGSGWLAGHAHELVVTMRSAAPAPVRAGPTRVVRSRHYPGGEWTYAKLYAPEDLHRRLIGHALPVLREQLPASVDRWFFVRYRDPHPHLRLRLHGPAGELIPLLHDWAREVCEADLAQRLVLDTYEPEISRYGGIAVLAAAERAFQADSEAAIAQLRLAPALPAELLVAANMVDLAASFGDPHWRDWLLHAVPRSEHHAAFQAIRAQAIAVIADGTVDPRLRAIWAERAPAVRAYGDAVRGQAGRSPLASLLHMHQIRLAGISPNAEARAHAIARGAVQVQVDRERHAR